MTSICRLFSFSALVVTPFCLLQAQVVEHVTMYRDAAVVTWKVENPQGSQVLARTLNPVGTREAHVMPSRADAPLGVTLLREMEWSAEDPIIRQAAADRADGLRLDAALKQVQLDLIEEDLAVLRANRGVGGTAESLLAEDLEEMADWMHDAFREALYRRAELHEELAVLDQAHIEALGDWEALAPVTAYEWTLQIPEGTVGAIRTQVVETQGAGWDPVDQLALNQDGTPSTWFQRIRYRLSVPHLGQAPMVFVDEWWSDHLANSTSFPGITVPLTGVKTKAKASEKSPREAGASIRTGQRSRYASNTPVNVGFQSGGTVTVGTWEVSFTRNAISQPRVAEVVDAWYSMSSVGKSIVHANQVQVVLDGTPLGPRSVVHEGDSLMVITGAAEDWTVSRTENVALCTRSNLGNRIRHHRAYSILVTNGSDRDGRVDIVEPLPRSRQLEIELNPDNLDGGSVNAVSETLHWSVELKSGESRTLSFSFDVEHDVDVRVSGYR